MSRADELRAEADELEKEEALANAVADNVLCPATRKYYVAHYNDEGFCGHVCKCCHAFVTNIPYDDKDRRDETEMWTYTNAHDDGTGYDGDMCAVPELEAELAKCKDKTQNGANPQITTDILKELLK